MSTCLSHLWDTRFLEGFSGSDCCECVFDFAKLLEECFGEPKAEIEETLDEFLERLEEENTDWDELLESLD